MSLSFAFGSVASAISTPEEAQADSSYVQGPGYVTLGFGRTQWVSSEQCVQLPNTKTLGEVAVELARRGMFGTGNIVLDRTNATTRQCFRGGVLQPSWTDIDALRSTYGWGFVSASRSYPNMTLLTKDQQIDQSCHTLPILRSHGIAKAWGMFAYPNNKWTAAIQLDPVSRCFAFGRTYVKWGKNLRAQMTTPWFQKTVSLNGGMCNDATKPCFTMRVGGNTRYLSPVMLGNWIQVAPDQWVVLQAYRFVTGVHTGSTFEWDCSSADWRSHWTSDVELYCWNDYTSILDRIPASAVIAQPGTVAQAWGRTVDTVAPSTTITSGPFGTTTATTATFAFTSSESNVTFECSLDAGAYTRCISGVSFSGLTAKTHTFAVRATDQAYNVGKAATRTWTVVPPA